MFRLPRELSRGISSIQAMRIAKMAPESGMLAMTIHSGPTGKESEIFKSTDSKGYVNRNGESVCNLVIPFLSSGYC